MQVQARHTLTLQTSPPASYIRCSVNPCRYSASSDHNMRRPVHALLRWCLPPPCVHIAGWHVHSCAHAGRCRRAMQAALQLRVLGLGLSSMLRRCASRRFSYDCPRMHSLSWLTHLLPMFLFCQVLASSVLCLVQASMRRAPRVHSTAAATRRRRCAWRPQARQRARRPCAHNAQPTRTLILAPRSSAAPIWTAPLNTHSRVERRPLGSAPRPVSARVAGSKARLAAQVRTPLPKRCYST